MNKLSTLLPLLLAVLFVSVGNAQSRRGTVISTYGNGDGDRFGATVSLSSDGTRIAVMAPDNGRFGTSSPSAEVYELQGSNWVKLGNTFTDYFSSPSDVEATIALSGSGTTVATGEPAFNTVSDFDAGRIVSYRYVSNAWTTVGNELNGTYQDAQLGKQIVLIENGTQMMTANFAGTENDPRGAFNLVLGSEWMTVGSQPILQSNNEIAVSAIALGRDGLRIAVGLDNGPDAPGTVQLFRFSGDWVSLGQLTGVTNGDGFGESIALADNGETAIVGAPSDGTGKVRVFDGTNTQVGSTLEGMTDDQAFGYSVDISEDGTRIAIGAPANDPASTSTGRVYVYDLIGGDWTLAYTFNGTVAGEQTGQSISLTNDGMYLAIGRPGYEAAGQSDAGQVDVFALDGSSSVREENILELRAFPNPAVSQLQLVGLPEGKSVAVVRDAIGRIMMEQALAGNHLDVTGLSSGYYLLEVRNEKGLGRIPFIKE